MIELGEFHWSIGVGGAPNSLEDRMVVRTLKAQPSKGIGNMRTLSSIRYLDSLSQDAEMRVRKSLDRTSVGFDKDLVTPLGDRADPRAGRIQRIHEISELVFPTGYEWLDDVERDRMEGIGPYSIMLPYNDRKPQVYQYFEQKTSIHYSPEALDIATEYVSSLIRSQLHSVSPDVAFADMPRGTNLGHPFYSSDFSEYGMATLEMARALIRGGFNDPVIPPCLLYWRGQPRGLDEITKQRTVWGFSHIVTILELMLQIPMLHALRKRHEFAAWVSTAAVDEVATNILDTAENDILSVDFSGFDASVNEILIHRVFDIIRNWFSTREIRLIDYVENVFLTTGLLTPEGILVDRHGGVPSGSGLTNLIDSLVQLLAFHYFASLRRNEVMISTVQGDDGVYSFTRRWELEDVQYVLGNLGLKVSSDKGGVSRDRVYYLQNVHSKDYRIDGVSVGVRPAFKVLNGMLSYERFHKHWEAADDTLRWRQQLFAAFRHPAFVKLVGWLYDNDRLSNLTIKQLVKLGGGRERVESALELKAFPYGKPTLSDMASSPVEIELQHLRDRSRAPAGRG